MIINTKRFYRFGRNRRDKDRCGRYIRFIIIMYSCSNQIFTIKLRELVVYNSSNTCLTLQHTNVPNIPQLVPSNSLAEHIDLHHHICPLLTTSNKPKYSRLSSLNLYNYSNASTTNTECQKCYVLNINMISNH